MSMAGRSTLRPHTHTVHPVSASLGAQHPCMTPGCQPLSSLNCPHCMNGSHPAAVPPVPSNAHGCGRTPGPLHLARPPAPILSHPSVPCNAVVTVASGLVLPTMLPTMPAC